MGNYDEERPRRSRFKMSAMDSLRRIYNNSIGPQIQRIRERRSLSRSRDRHPVEPGPKLRRQNSEMWLPDGGFHRESDPLADCFHVFSQKHIKNRLANKRNDVQNPSTSSQYTKKNYDLIESYVSENFDLNRMINSESLGKYEEIKEKKKAEGGEEELERTVSRKWKLRGGRVVPINGVVQKPYLMRSNSSCHSSKVIEISQEWSIKKETINGIVEILFIPTENLDLEYIGSPDGSIRQNFGPSIRKFSTRDRQTQTSLVEYEKNQREKEISEMEKTLLKQLEMTESPTAHRRILSTKSSSLILETSEIPKNSAQPNTQTKQNIQLYVNSKISVPNSSQPKNIQREEIKDIEEGMKEVEKVIFDVSDELTKQELSSKGPRNSAALKKKLHEVIIRVNPFKELKNNVELTQKDVFKEPIVVLKERIRLLEEEMINCPNEKLLEESASEMSPLVSRLKEKLDILDNAGNSLQPADLSVLERILMEIEKIHELCRGKLQKEDAELVVSVLSKVYDQIDDILKAIYEDINDESNSIVTNTTEIQREAAKPLQSTPSESKSSEKSQETIILRRKHKEEIPREEENKAKIQTEEPLKETVMGKLEEAIKKEEQKRREETKEESLKEIKGKEERTEVNGSFVKVQRNLGTNLTVRIVSCIRVEENFVVIPRLKDEKEAKNEFNDGSEISKMFTFNRPSASNEATSEWKSGKSKMEMFSLSQYVFDDGETLLGCVEQSDAQTTDTEFIPLTNRRAEETFDPFKRKPSILSEESDSSESSVFVTNIQNSFVENFMLKRRRRNYRVTAYVYPAVQEKLLIDIAENNDARVTPTISIPEWKYIPQRYANCSHETISNDERTDASQCTSARMSVSITAHSGHEILEASINELPWESAEINVSQTLNAGKFSEGRGLLNVSVAANEPSINGLPRRPSEVSLPNNRNSDVPVYAIKRGSSATITCELKNFVPGNAQIEWFWEQKHIIPENFSQKYERISEPHVEILIVSDVDFEDSGLYSITVENEIFPVAYLHIDDYADPNTVRHFITPPQTMFVMEGQTAILSCQVLRLDAQVSWYIDEKPLKGNKRISFQNDADGWHRAIIDEVLPSDQGIYYAMTNDGMTTIELVVEGIISEKEVPIRDGVGTPDVSDYLVPEGSTATIACELQGGNGHNELLWQKDGNLISMEKIQKYERVANGNKYYLIIHNTTKEDSGIYNVEINGTSYVVAQITIAQIGDISLANSPNRNFSTSSICI